MIIKVCGIKHNENLKEISKMDIDMVGFNFYSESPRFLDQPLPSYNSTILKVGVFVNASQTFIEEQVDAHKLDFVQLHGDETSNFAESIHEFKPVIKVFRIDESFDPKVLSEFEFCSYFLFDTSTKHFGGSGLKFNWEILDDLDIKIPFLLSGGIGPNDAAAILKIKHPYFRGIDINSKFEIEPGLKNIAHIQQFIKAIKN